MLCPEHTYRCSVDSHQMLTVCGCHKHICHAAAKAEDAPATNSCYQQPSTSPLVICLSSGKALRTKGQSNIKHGQTYGKHLVG